MLRLGKTALHWAAAVNNEEAAKLLVSHGANCDAQDDRNQTPLFFAAREGSFNVAAILLHHCNADMNIPDHMDCLPRDVALQRFHMDIVKLLDECSHLPTAHCSTSLYNIEHQAIALPPAANIILPQAASKTRSKKCTTTAAQRKQSARSVNSSVDSEDDVLLRASTSHTQTAAQKKSKRRRAAAATATSSDRNVPTGLNGDDHSIGIVPEQPPSYEHAMLASLRRQSEAAYKQHVSYDMADINHNPTYPATGNRIQSPQGGSAAAAANIAWSSNSSSCADQVHSWMFWTDASERPAASGWSPLSATQLSPADMGPVHTQRAGRRSQPLSPIHMQAMMQNQMHRQCYQQNQQPDLQFQYPTPQSHYSNNDATSPPLTGQLHQPLGGFPTPSPEASPGQWSSSPQSARSEWSEPSPQLQYTTSGATAIKRESEQGFL